MIYKGDLWRNMIDRKILEKIFSLEHSGFTVKEKVNVCALLHK